jgi:hypothetical protein
MGSMAAMAEWGMGNADSPNAEGGRRIQRRRRKRRERRNRWRLLRRLRRLRWCRVPEGPGWSCKDQHLRAIGSDNSDDHIIQPVPAVHVAGDERRHGAGQLDALSVAKLAAPVARQPVKRLAAMRRRDYVPMAIGIEIARPEEIRRFGQLEHPRLRAKGKLGNWETGE